MHGRSVIKSSGNLHQLKGQKKNYVSSVHPLDRYHIWSVIPMCVDPNNRTAQITSAYIMAGTEDQVHPSIAARL